MKKCEHKWFLDYDCSIYMKDVGDRSDYFMGVYCGRCARKITADQIEEILTLKKTRKTIDKYLKYYETNAVQAQVFVDGLDISKFVSGINTLKIEKIK